MGGTGMTQLFQRKRTVLAYCLGLFVILSAMHYGVFCILQTDSSKARLEKAISGEQHLQRLINSDLSLRVGRTVSDVLYLADRINNTGTDDESIKVLTNDFISLANHRQVFDYIRLFDTNRMELLRVNFYSEGSYAINGLFRAQLPDQVPFFDEASKMSYGQVYVSRMELFRNRGVLQRPLKPLITVSTPVFKDGMYKGVFAVCYNAKYILNVFQEVSAGSEGQMYWLNTDGYYLSNKQDPDAEFAFEYEDKQDISFWAKYPDAFARMIKEKQGYFETSDGYYVFTSISPYNGYLGNGARLYNNGYKLGEDKWLAVSFISRQNLRVLGITTSFWDMTAYILQTQWPVYLFIFMLSLVLGLLLVYGKLSRDRIRYFSEYDCMTGALNRRAGVVMLERSCREAVRDQQKLSVCFTDVDGLKQVNDQLGHEKGDELLIGVVGGIKRCIRQHDYVIRLGGDEFLIVFIKAGVEQAETAWQRICAEYDRVNTTEHRPYLLSASHGIAEITPDVKRVIDEVLSEADAKMYAEKRLIKMGLKVIRE